LAHLSILSKKLLGLSFVFLVEIHLTLEPDFKIIKEALGE
jgi:hypothetical protein